MESEEVCVILAVFGSEKPKKCPWPFLCFIATPCSTNDTGECSVLVLSSLGKNNQADSHVVRNPAEKSHYKLKQAETTKVDIHSENGRKVAIKIINITTF